MSSFVVSLISLLFFRQILRKCVIDLLENKDLFNRIHNYIPILMKIFAKNSDLNLLLETTLTIIDNINSESIETEAPITTTIAVSQPSQPTAISTESIVEQLRQFELEYAKLSVRVESLKDDLESANKEGNQLEAQKIEELIESLSSRMSEIIERRLRIAASQIEPFSHQSSQQSTENEVKTQKTLTVIEFSEYLFCCELIVVY